jgi:plasmid stabilization system protein ParE
MTARYVLASQAALDLFEIWQFIKEHSSLATADHVESVIREKFVFLASSPEAGHRRANLTEHKCKVFSGVLPLDCLPAANQPPSSRFDNPRSSRRGANSQGLLVVRTFIPRFEF